MGLAFQSNSGTRKHLLIICRSLIISGHLCSSPLRSLPGIPVWEGYSLLVSVAPSPHPCPATEDKDNAE